jgi:hypothetical protein
LHIPDLLVGRQLVELVALLWRLSESALGYLIETNIPAHTIDEDKRDNGDQQPGQPPTGTAP